MNINIAIVDDLKQDRERLEECIKDFFARDKSNTVLVETFNKAEDFLPVFCQGKYHLAFLDILMDEMNGIQLARELRKMDQHLMIIFQTTERSYAFDAFPIHPFDYLIKPCRQEDVDAVLKEAMRVLEAGDPVIEVTALRATYSVPLRSIIAVTSKGHSVEITLANRQSLTVTDTFKSLSSKIETDERFLLINRGVIINMDHVLSPTSDGMQMKNGQIFPIKINGKTGILAEFSQYMISKVDKRG